MRILVTIICLATVFTMLAQENEAINKSFAKIKWSTKSQNHTVKNKFGKKWQLRITFPEKVGEEKVPLVIALHWNGTGDTYEIFHDCLAVPGTKKINAIVVSPEAEAQLWDTKNNTDKVFDIIDYAKTNWSVDPDKVLVMGYSNGGIGSWYYAEHHPEVFSAAIPISGFYATKKKIEIPVYAIHAAKDELFPLKRMQSWVDIAKEKGSDITFVINEQLTHKEACNFVAELEKAVDWVLEKVFDP